MHRKVRVGIARTPGLLNILQKSAPPLQLRFLG